MNNMLPLAMNYLVVRNNDTHHYNTRENQLTIILCPLSTPKPCVFCITFDLSKPYLRDCSFEISVSVLLTII